MENVLLFEKRGCDFWGDDSRVPESDIGNYRIVAHNVKMNGREYIIEVTSYYKPQWRLYYKRDNTKELQKPVLEGYKQTMYFRTQYDTENGSFGDIQLEIKLNNPYLPYTRKNILDTINKYSDIKYNDIKII